MVNQKRLSKLPDWFELVQYENLQELSLESLIKIIDSRSIKLSLIKSMDLTAAEMRSLILEHGIINWSVIDDFSDYHAAIINDKVGISDSNIIVPLILAHVSSLLSNLALEDKSNVRVSINKITDQAYEPVHFEKPHAHTMLSKIDDGTLYCGIELNATDEEILTELRFLLPLYRKHLKVEEPVKAPDKKIGLSTVKNIIHYKVVPFLDLIIWESLTGATFSKELIARCLYPEPLERGDFVSSKNIIETREPFVRLFIKNDEFIDRVRSWSKQELMPGITPFKMTIADLMKA